MNLTLITPPAVEPVTLAEAKEHLRVVSDDEDTMIEGLIVAARQMVESGESWSLDRSLITTTWRLSLDEFDNTSAVIELPRPPAIAITSLTYTNSTGTTTTLSGSGYSLDAYSTPGRLVPAYGLQWPSVRTQAGRSNIAITYTAGYGATAADVPQAIKQAILLCVGDLYEQREMTITGTIVNVLPTVRALLNPFQWRYR